MFRSTNSKVHANLFPYKAFDHKKHPCVLTKKLIRVFVNACLTERKNRQQRSSNRTYQWRTGILPYIFYKLFEIMKINIRHERHERSFIWITILHTSFMALSFSSILKKQICVVLKEAKTEDCHLHTNQNAKCFFSSCSLENWNDFNMICLKL